MKRDTLSKIHKFQIRRFIIERFLEPDQSGWQTYWLAYYELQGRRMLLLKDQPQKDTLVSHPILDPAKMRINNLDELEQMINLLFEFGAADDDPHTNPQGSGVVLNV
jgi:hypothetical protein